MSIQTTNNQTLRSDDQVNTQADDEPSETNTTTFGRSNRQPITDTTPSAVSPWNHLEITPFKVDDEFKFDFPIDFDDEDPLFPSGEDNPTFTVQDIRIRLSSEMEHEDLDELVYEYFNDCKQHFFETYSCMLEPLVKNQEHIAKLDLMQRHGQFAKKVAITIPHIAFHKDPMDRLAQAEKECNEDLEKYSQDVNKHIHDILLA